MIEKPIKNGWAKISTQSTMKYHYYRPDGPINKSLCGRYETNKDGEVCHPMDHEDNCHICRAKLQKEGHLNWTEVMEGMEIARAREGLRATGHIRDLLRKAALELLRLLSRSGHPRIGDRVKVLRCPRDVSLAFDEWAVGKTGEVIGLDANDETLPYRVRLDEEFGGERNWWSGGERNWWFGPNDLELIPPTESVSSAYHSSESKGSG